MLAKSIILIQMLDFSFPQLPTIWFRASKISQH